MKKNGKRIISIILGLLLIVSSFPEITLASSSDELCLLDNEVWASLPETSVVSVVKSDVSSDYGTDHYDEAVCWDITISGVEEFQEFELDVRTLGVPPTQEDFSKAISFVGFSKDEELNEGLWYEILQDAIGSYSSEDGKYINILELELENGVMEFPLFYYRENIASYNSELQVPSVIVIRIHVGSEISSDELCLLDNEVWASLPETSVVSVVKSDVSSDYGTDHYDEAVCWDITISGVEEFQEFELDVRTLGVPPTQEDFSKAISFVGFSKDEELNEGLWYEILQDAIGSYSSEDGKYINILELELENGVMEFPLFYYRENIASYNSELQVPSVIVIRIHVGSSDIPEPPVDEKIILKAVPSLGQFENVNALFGLTQHEQTAYDFENATYLIVPKDTETVNVTLTFNANNYDVTVNGLLQDEISEENMLTVTLNAAPLSKDGMSQNSINKIIVTNGGEETTYQIFVVNKRFEDLPDSVIEYLCIGSQYTNDRSAAGDFGTRAVRSLVGSNYTAGGKASGPVSLGGFGGYIVYKYDEPIKNDPNNPFGIDFIIFGNAVRGNQEFGEPGQVWVSEDGTNWYALAGGMHYEDYANWNYSLKYSKNKNGSTKITSEENSNTYNDFYYPNPLKYPYYAFDTQSEVEMTVSGICFESANEHDSSGSTVSRHAGFGYADLGSSGTKLPNESAEGWLVSFMPTEIGYEKLARNIALNPYAKYPSGSNVGYFDLPTDGMDLSWAVDADGNPVALSNGVHFIKIVTASNIINEGLGEKSTEVNMVRVARASETPVGISTAPESISFDGNIIGLKTGTEISRNVYAFNDVKVSGPFIVDVDAENSNVYINNTAKSSVVYDKIPDHKIIRVIVQEGEKEPLIYVFNLVEGEEETNAVLTVDANGGKVNGNETYAMTFDAGMAGYELPEPTNTDASVEFAGWYYGQRLYTEIPSDVRDITLTAKWESAESDDPSGNTDDTIRVSFRLIGSTIASEDVDLSKGEEGYYTAEYQNWIKTRTYTMHSDDSVYDLFVKATGDASIESKGANKGYVSSIKAPDSLGGYWLSEFTNGKYSGWMYTMDGKHTDAIKDQKLKDGADVVFHYVNDYRYEVEDWFDEPAYPAAATDGEFYNRWLEAADVRPGSQGGTTPVDPAAEQPVETPENPGGAADRFIDVESNDWFAGSVDYAVEKGFMTGTGADTFSPDKELTRGMLVSMLYSLEGVPAEDGKTAFDDVKTSDWFAKGVDWAVENGVAAGYGENFGPNDDITREQMVVMLYGYAKLKDYTLAEGADLSAYKDADEISAWALEAVRWAKGANLITGRSADKLAPKGTTTRAEAATILRNFLENVAK